MQGSQSGPDNGPADQTWQPIGAVALSMVGALKTAPVAPGLGRRKAGAAMAKAA